MRETVAALCKVNLTLDVFAPRPDGYHELDSLVITFTPADKLTLDCEASATGRHEVRLSCDDADLPIDDRNLAVKAAWSFLGHLPHAPAYAIDITLGKNLPHQAGLGGGSSDAAAVLRALASQIALPPGVSLLAIAAGIGSDVPLFLANGPVRMRGRGEHIEALTRSPRGLHGVIVKPDRGVPTAVAYLLLDALPVRPPADSTRRLVALLDAAPSIDALADALHNDFEAAIMPYFPEVAAAHAAVRGVGALRALLCGSGAAVFGLARDRAHAESLTDRLRGRFPFVARAEQTEIEPTVAR